MGGDVWVLIGGCFLISAIFLKDEAAKTEDAARIDGVVKTEPKAAPEKYASNCR